MPKSDEERDLKTKVTHTGHNFQTQKVCPYFILSICAYGLDIALPFFLHSQMHAAGRINNTNMCTGLTSDTGSI